MCKKEKTQAVAELLSLRKLQIELEVGMVLQQADGTIRACNVAAEQMLGLTTE